MLGHWSYRALFTDGDAALARYSNSNDAVGARRVGLYLSDADLARMPREVVRARVIGKVADCADLDGDNVVMVFGYCHYTGGPFLNVSSITALE